MIERYYADHGYLLDPHTAVGVAAAEEWLGSGATTPPLICLATAHPAKFPDAIKSAGLDMEVTLPPHLSDLFQRSERLEVLPNELSAVEII